MKVVNQTRDLVLSDDAALAQSFLSRLRGLLFSGPRDLVLVSPRQDIPASTIHMLGMSFPIDVVWLDTEKAVVDVALQVPPAHPLRPATLRVYKPRRPAKYVVELGRGRATSTKIGDTVIFSD